MSETRAFVADVRRAAAGVRVAVEQAMGGYAPISKCVACERLFYFLTATGLEATAAERCPKCETEGGSEQGLGLEVDAFERMVRDRHGLVLVAREVARSQRCTVEDAVLYLERLEAGEDGFRSLLALAKKATSLASDAWRGALVCWTEGLALAAVHHPVAAQMALLAATARPEAVERVTVRLGKVVLYDGDVTPEAGRIIRKGEDEHGRKLRVKLRHKDGTVTHRRGERETAPENVIPTAFNGGIRTMMLERRPLETPNAAAVEARERRKNEEDARCFEALEAAVKAGASLRAECKARGHDETVPLSEDGVIRYVCRRCGEVSAVGIHPSNYEALGL
jgi:hypothetical protein